MLSIYIHSMMAIVAPAGTMRISGSRHMDILPWIGMDSVHIGRQISSEVSPIVTNSNISSDTTIKPPCKQGGFIVVIAKDQMKVSPLSDSSSDSQDDCHLPQSRSHHLFNLSHCFEMLTLVSSHSSVADPYHSRGHRRVDS